MGLGEFLRDALDGVELDDELAEELDPEVCKGHLCDCNRCTERREANPLRADGRPESGNKFPLSISATKPFRQRKEYR